VPLPVARQCEFQRPVHGRSGSQDWEWRQRNPAARVGDESDIHLIVEVTSFDHVLVSDVIVARDEPRPSDVEQRTRSGGEGFFTPGDELAEELDCLKLPPAQLEFRLGNLVPVRGADGHLEIDDAWWRYWEPIRKVRGAKW